MAGYIAFKTHMARKVLDNAKTQTRRIITAEWARCLDLDDPDDVAKAIDQAPHKSGDMLWVREPMTIVDVRFTVTKLDSGDVVPTTLVRSRYGASTVEDFGRETNQWREYPQRLAEPRKGRSVAYGCPREFARGAVEITSVRCERLQSISASDARAEGVDVETVRPGSVETFRNYTNGDGYCTSPIDSFRTLWDSINAARGFGWDANPHVFVYSFRQINAAEVTHKKERQS